MRYCLLASLLTLLLGGINAIAEQDETRPASEAIGSLTVEPIGLDGRPLQKNSISLWQQVPRNDADNELWHDADTETWWKALQGFATSGISTFEHLAPGRYRVAVREGHDQTGAFGLGDVVTIDADHPRVSTKVHITPGAELHLVCTDEQSGKPIPPPRFGLELISNSFWKGRQFAAQSLPGEPGQFVFRNLPEGKYRLQASQPPSHPDDVKYTLVGDRVEVSLKPKETVTRELKFRAGRPTDEEIAQRWPWIVRGTVTDDNGDPVAGAVVRAHAGMGTLFQTGAALTDADGKYTLRFGPGVHIAEGGDNVQVALITASKPGMQETNLCRHGSLAMANKKHAESSDWFKDQPLILPNEPREIDFTMSPAGMLHVNIYHENRGDFRDLHVSLKGDEMPPGSSVVDSGTADRWGSISFADVPLNKEWWIEISSEDLPPIRSRSFRLTAPQRYELSLEWRTNAEGVEVLDVVSLLDALSRDQTVALVDE